MADAVGEVLGVSGAEASSAGEVMLRSLLYAPCVH